MRRRPPGEEADAAAALVESLAVLLDAGLTPRMAWTAVAEHRAHPVAARVVASLRVQSSCARALREVASTDDLRTIAAAWCVADGSGAPVGHVLRVVSDALRDIAEGEREAEVAVSGPRATARLVSWLPAAGAVLAAALGTDLLAAATTAAGVTALAAGAGLMLAGLLWMRALVRRALARPALPGLASELVAVALGGGASAEAACAAARRAAADAGLPELDDAAARDVLALADSAGAPAVELLTASARRERRVARAEARRKAAVLGVRLMLPLGVCVLPSFLLLAVVPLLLSLLASTTAGLR